MPPRQMTRDVYYVWGRNALGTRQILDSAEAPGSGARALEQHWSSTGAALEQHWSLGS
jgi:hypothetical protein